MNTQNFKPIPEFENYGISKDGIVINFKKKQRIKNILQIKMDIIGQDFA